MRTSISKYLIAGLVALSVTASVFAMTEPASAGGYVNQSTSHGCCVRQWNPVAKP
jgi:hypothetical protein